MPEVATAATATHFDAGHTIARVRQFFDVFRFDRLVIAGPAGARFKFSLRREERQFAGSAYISSLFVVVVVFPRERPFGALFAQNLELFGGEQFLPFGVGFMDFLRHRYTAFLFRLCLGGSLTLQQNCRSEHQAIDGQSGSHAYQSPLPRRHYNFIQI